MSSPNAIDVIRQVKSLQHLSEDETVTLSKLLTPIIFKPGETVFNEGDSGNCAFIVLDGTFILRKFGRSVRYYHSGELFGEVALLDERSRTGSIVAKTAGTLLRLHKDDLQNESAVSPGLLAKVYKGFATLISSYIREADALYDEMDVLLIQDGGCAPGYNSVTAYLTEYLEKAGRKVFIAAEGFKSLVSNRTEDYRGLIYDSETFHQMDNIRGVIFSPPLRTQRGADFRTERFPDFKQPDVQKTAVQSILDRKVKTVIGIGGNGTFAGINALSKQLPDSIGCYFIPVTIDSDVYGTSCIGEFTGVEVGAEKIRCYMADARTHKRCYIIEMMGAQGGYHALHSCLGAGAHLAVLPQSEYDIKALAQKIGPRTETVIVVAEGYKRKERRARGIKQNAAEYFRDELLEAGLQTGQKIVCEAFSRDVRGAMPNNLDITLAQRMARQLCTLMEEGANRVMPAVQAGNESSIPFDEIRTDNSVNCSLAALANRL